MRRAGGEAYRNLLVSTAQGSLPSSDVGRPLPGPLGSIIVSCSLLESDIAAALATLLLPPMTPLSLLAVEFFNLEVDVIDYQYGAASEQAEEQVLYGNAARQTSAGTAPQYRLAAPKQDPAVSRSRRRPYRQ